MSETRGGGDAGRALTFEYVAGDVALDLVNTAGWTDDGRPVDDRLATYDALTWWAEGAGLVPAATGAGLRRQGGERPGEARAALDRARSLRSLLERAFAGVLSGGVGDADLQGLNAAFADALAHLHLAADAADPRRLAWAWRAWGDALECMLWPVAWSAARLLASPECDDVRRCDDARCGWLFVDRSRNGLRRWCRTDVCGARAKARRHHARTRAAGGGGRGEGAA